MKENNNQFTLDELGSLTNQSKRTVRYYIQIGLVDRPDGAGRGAHYTKVHLDQLLEIQKWQQAGLSLERIRDLAGNSDGKIIPPPVPGKPGTVEVWSHLLVRDGVEILIDPKRAQLSPEQVRKFSRGVIDLFENISRKGEKNE